MDTFCTTSAVQCLTEQSGTAYNTIVLAVGIQTYQNLGPAYFRSIAQGELILFDLKGLYQGQREEADFYWSLYGKNTMV